MIWYKAWLETRSRLAWSAFLIVTMLFLHVFTSSDFLKRAPRGEEAGTLATLVQAVFHATAGTLAFRQGLWQMFFILMSALIAPTIGLLMAGSGINTQTFYGMRQGVHPSMIFTLSLPVRRGRWILARAGLGALETTALTLLMLLIPPMLNPLFGTSYSWSVALVAWPFLMLPTMAFYWFSVLLATFLDELWQGLISLAAVGAVAGFSMSGAIPGVQWAGYLTGAHYLMTGTMPWGTILLCTLLSMAFYYAAVAVIERREF